ncbi:MAG: YcxB family protein [Pirellulales bacterium]
MSDNPYQSPGVGACRTDSREGGPPIRLVGKIEESDYVRAQWLHLCAGRLIAVLGIVIVLVFAVASVLAIVEWIGRGAVASEPPVLPLLMLFFAGYAAFLSRRFSRSYRNYKAIQTPITVELTEEGFHGTSAHGETRLGWDMFQRYKESTRLFLLYQTANLFHVLPKRLFADADDVNRARDLFSRKVKRGHRS